MNDNDNDSDNNIYIKSDVLSREELKQFKEIVYKILKNDKFFFSYKERCLMYTIDSDKEYDLTKYVDKIINNLVNINKKYEKKEVCMKLFSSKEEEEYNIDSFEKQSVSLKYSFKILDPHIKKSLLCESVKWESAVINLINHILTNSFSNVIEFLLSGKHTDTINSDMKDKLTEVFVSDGTSSEIIKLLKELMNNEFTERIEENRSKIEKLYSYHKNYLKQIIFESLMNLKNNQDLVYSYDKENFKNKILEDSNIVDEKIINYIYEELLFCVNEYKLFFLNCFDSQGHYKILIPGDPICKTFFHMENSCIAYPGYYINKKKKSMVNLDDMEGYLLIKLFVNKS